jgi:hypothetical protein
MGEKGARRRIRCDGQQNSKIEKTECREVSGIDKMHPDNTLKEIGTIFGERDAFVLYRIRKLGITDNKTTLPKGPNEEKLRAFIKFLSKKQVKDLIFVNESGINHQDLKEYAWSEKGVKVIGERCGNVHHRGKTAIAAAYCRKIISPFYFDDYTNIDNSCILLEKGSMYGIASEASGHQR